MADGPEKKIEDKVVAYAKTKGFLVYKFTSPNRVSVPDRLFVIPGGKVFFIEFKAPGKKAAPKQAREHELLRNQGSIVYLVDDVYYGKLVIDRMCLDAEPVSR
jgi:hypothetical protein